MSENLHKSKEFLKRADHGIYVSFKYVKSTEVLRNILSSLVLGLDSLVMAFMDKLIADDVIPEMPTVIGFRIDQIRQNFSEARVLEFIDFYLLLRKMQNSDFSKINEFKRHVTMIYDICGQQYEVEIDHLTDYYKRALTYYEEFSQFLNV